MSSTVSRTPGILLGLGLGGFLDGILLHQIVHWHNMGSARLPPVTVEALQTNMRWDGLFHVAVWTLCVLGVYRLLKDARRGLILPGPGAFTGLLLMGWGIFNLVEGSINHHLLALHHVRDVPVHVPLYDWVFLVVLGIGLIAFGRWMSRAAV
jgi:uncharacterized membrane protein